MEEKIMAHSFHIPVMGTGYTIDTPLKVAHFGINSVVSIIDHMLIEQIREYHCKMHHVPFMPISENDIDCRAKRITAYLNLIENLVHDNFERLKNSSFEAGTEITKYFEMLPDSSSLKEEYNLMLLTDEKEMKTKQAQLKKKIICGEIHVNIMTKIDRINYTKDNEALPAEYNDANAALRGFANSNLNSSLVLSAGLNPRLFAYLASFDSFFPDSNGQLKKKIILKVSDYRSALIQGKFLAKKGIWVSEFRIESGLNCGGHAFATDGLLLGPILNEFRENKNQLINTLFEIYSAALKNSNKEFQKFPPALSITVQGGVGTYKEHKFLMEYYNVDSVGWGSPFLLVPEVVNIDKDTMELIARTDEQGFYTSNISPLGVPFNTIRGTSGEIEKQNRIKAGKPGAACLKKRLLYNTEFTERPICTASLEYQKMKIEELQNKNLNKADYEMSYQAITAKECLCIGLGNSMLLKKNLNMYKGFNGVNICPGPNLAYFSEIVPLRKMVDHIYGKTNIIKRTDRPHMFVQELKLYINYLKTKIDGSFDQMTETQIKYFETFQTNLHEGINYYKQLFSNLQSQFEAPSSIILNEFESLENQLRSIKITELQPSSY
jgi:hypothetical protein